MQVIATPLNPSVIRCGFREVLSKQAVGVLVCAALPRALGITEVDLQPGIDV
jgi:hypothetical protein